MRLDHLLSKEHLTRRPLGLVVQSHVCRRMCDRWCSRVEHQLRVSCVASAASVLLRLRVGGGTSHGWSGAGVMGTLLGPEGTARMSGCCFVRARSVGRTAGSCSLGVGAGRRRLLVGDRSLFENCTVDASIF